MPVHHSKSELIIRHWPQSKNNEIFGMTYMTTRENISNVEAICREIGDASGKTILDIGCGTGELCRALADLGANVIGIDPGENAIKQAKELGGEANYQVAMLDELDTSPSSLDVVIFCTSLHHIPNMADALQGAIKLVKNTGKIIVVEPQPDDPLYPVYRWLDDEKDVQIQAQNAIDGIIESQQVSRTKTLFLNKKYRCASLDALIDDMMEVDASRSLSDEARKSMATAYEATMQQDSDGDYIDHWYRLDVLKAL